MFLKSLNGLHIYKLRFGNQEQFVFCFFLECENIWWAKTGYFLTKLFIAWSFEEGIKFELPLWAL